MANPTRVPLEQRRYALLQDWGTRIGFAVLVASFLAYVSGLLPAYVPLERLPVLWKLPVRTFVQQTATPTGWGWLAHLAYGEFASLAGIAILAGCSLLGLAAALAVYGRRGDRRYAAICLATLIVVLLAAAGVAAPGR